MQVWIVMHKGKILGVFDTRKTAKESIEFTYQAENVSKCIDYPIHSIVTIKDCEPFAILEKQVNTVACLC